MSDPVLQRVLDVAYQASLTIEERRPVKFGVVLLPRDERAVLSALQTRVPLAEPRVFSVQEVMRLAPALDPRTTMIAVEPVDSAPTSSRLQIWGVVTVGSRWWESLHGRGNPAQPPPNALTVSVAEPGSLTVSRRGEIVLSLRRGRLIEPMAEALWEGPVSEFFQESRHDFYHQVCAMLDRDEFDPVGQDETFPAREFTRTLERLLFEIRSLGHGGTVLFVPNDFTFDDPRLTRVLKIGYPMEQAGGIDPVVPHLGMAAVHHQLSHELDHSLFNGRKPVPRKSYRERVRAEGLWDLAEHQVTDGIRFVAGLSAVDGALVLTNQLRVLGFGAMITAGEEVRAIRIARSPDGSGSERAVEGYGTRHRAAFRFCAALADSLAFIVSQDGGVKAVRQVGRHLTIWEDINAGRLGS